MMKGKSTIGLIVVLLMIIGVQAGASQPPTGQPSPSETVAAALEAMTNAETYTESTVMQFSMDTVWGLYDVTLRGDTSISADSIRGRTEAGLKMGEQSIGVEYYTVSDDGEFAHIYQHFTANDMDLGWTRNLRRISREASPYFAPRNFDFYAPMGDGFAADGEEEVGGKIATRYSGALSGWAAVDALPLAHMGEVLGFIFYDWRAKDAAALLDAMADSGDIAVSFWIDGETGALLRYSVNLTDMMDTMLRNIEMFGADAEAKITHCTITTDITQDAVDFDIPEEAQDAEGFNGMGPLYEANYE